MGYYSSTPSKRDKQMFIIGITIGALLSFLGSYIVTATFRLLDFGYTLENIIFIITPLIVFIILLLKIPSIIKKL